MNLRTITIVLLTLTIIVTAMPTNQSVMIYNAHSGAHQSLAHATIDPNATLTAFNYTLAQADIFTYQDARLTPTSGSTFFKTFSSFNHTKDGSAVLGSAFNFTVPKGTSAGQQMISWNFSIPKSNCTGCSAGTVLSFTYDGMLTTNTFSNYTLTLFNTTRVATDQKTGPLNFTSTTSSTGCPATSACIPVGKYVGYNMTLTFKFVWQSSSNGMVVSIGELLIGAIAPNPTPAVANWMVVRSTDSTKIDHTAKLSLPIVNSTVQYSNPYNAGHLLNHTWANQVLNIYYPSGYNLTGINANSTRTLFPFPNTVSASAFETEHCANGTPCTQGLLALNMSDIAPSSPLILRNTMFTITAVSENTLHPSSSSTTVTTGFGNVTLSYFEPGDNMTVKVVNKPSTSNMTVAQANPAFTISFIAPMGNTTALTGQSFSTTTTGGLFGFRLPQGPFGIWNATVSYLSNFDLGYSSTIFRLDELTMIPQSVKPTVTGNMLSVTSKIFNSTGQPITGIIGTVFAADASSNAIPVTNSNVSSTGGLYISNVTLVNGVFTTGQTLTMFFQIVNPTRTGQYAANLTIEHEWSPGQVHGVNVTIPLKLGDEPFTLNPILYKAEVTFGTNDMQAKITSVQTQNFRGPIIFSSNSTSPVIPSRQHTGLFKFVLYSNLVNGTISRHSNSIESPPYAYVLAGPETSSGYLTHSTPFTTASDGSFTSLIPANQTIGAGKLVIFALARNNNNGLVLWNGLQDPTSATDNTRLISSADRIGELTVGQTATATLHLKNNSTTLAQSITIDLYLGTSKLTSQSVSMQPLDSKTLQYIFKAPSTPGTYTLTFSSAQYRGPLTTQSIQVVLVPGLIQLLIPLITGVIAAIAVLSYYLVKGRRTSKTSTTTTSTKTTASKPS